MIKVISALLSILVFVAGILEVCIDALAMKYASMSMSQKIKEHYEKIEQLESVFNIDNMTDDEIESMFLD